MPAEVGTSGANDEKAAVALSLNEATMTSSTRPKRCNIAASFSSYGSTTGAVCLMSRLSTTPANSSSTSSNRAIPKRRSPGARPRNGYRSAASPGETSAPGAHQ